ncbi:MAG: hypothetical protein A4E66_01436 [Syntrophus sp. PtaB.Bin001]|jgi:prepilin-type N-terminal cleavage/methylation domain-containing protein|nr:MAG: hypothetical protein A4E66_01436 [Syntrophus sp. PtaB.Bin001]
MKLKIKTTELKRIDHHTAGFTLIEIMVAIFILTVALIAMAGMTEMVIKENALSKSRTTATILAKSQLEELKNMAYANLAGGGDFATADGTIQATLQPNTYFTRTWIVNPGVPNTGSITITVTVTWSLYGNNRNVTLQTIRTS